MARVLLLALLLIASVGCAASPDPQTATGRAPAAMAEARGAAPMSQPASPGADAVEDGRRRAAGPRAAAVLRAWDAERADAWAAGDPRLLADLYTRGSGAGRRDRAMLRAWTARGLSVHGMETQLLSVREVRRTRTAWTLLVTDRLAGGSAAGRGVQRALPLDQATKRTVRLRLVEGRWRVSAVWQGEPPGS